MVGRQTSHGCATCRIRRVKCDLSKPACAGCVKGSRLCPGYPDRFVSVSNTCSRHREAGESSKPLVTDHASGMRLPKTILSDTDRLRYEFVWKMEGDALAARLAMMPATHVLKHVPQRIGCSQALDDAVACLAHTRDTGKLYVTALGSLRTALEHPLITRTPETLAAASLLQMYEQYVDLPGRRWIYHARGVIRILQARGPAKITNEIERAVLGAQAANVFMSALTVRSNCFLASPAWFQVLRPPSALAGRLDLFVQTIVDGVHFPNVDGVYAQLIGACYYASSITQAHRRRLANVAIADFLRIRTKLKKRLDCGPVDPPGINDASTIATYAATEFFLVVTITVVLNMYDELEDLCGDKPLSFSGEESPDLLKAERSSILRVVSERFKLLDVLSPELRFTAPVALRAILGAALGLGGPSKSEAATLLLVLDKELEDCRWDSTTRHVPLLASSVP